jgi:hypothetical protein
VFDKQTRKERWIRKRTTQATSDHPQPLHILDAHILRITAIFLLASHPPLFNHSRLIQRTST